MTFNHRFTIDKKMQTTKTTPAAKPTPLTQSERVIHSGRIALLVAAFGLAFVLGTSGFQTYFSTERRLIAAADEIVTALKAYRDASPGTVKEFPLELANLKHDPRMLADVGYLTDFPVDPIAQKQTWGVVRNKSNQVVGVPSLSNDAPTMFARWFAFKGGEKYSEWKFLAE